MGHGELFVICRISIAAWIGEGALNGAMIHWFYVASCVVVTTELVVVQADSGEPSGGWPVSGLCI